MPIEDEKLKKNIVRISIFLFVLSLTQKCYCTTSNCSDSFLVLFLGWAALFSGGAGLCWIANPLLWSAWFLLKRKLKTAMFLSVLSTLLSLFFLLFDRIVDNESGGQHQIISYRAGYWLWVGSNATMLLGTYILMYRYNVKHKTTAKVRHF